ncbi:hypothetical protein [Paenibacillus faecalis]|uniref:hypothetical protein n=1 Tax=Paenibacillus faecalis TaxID=2079532 RepID=UPI001F2EE1D0|nr:hypothetical protein [Paenibacillus faecalis]
MLTFGCNLDHSNIDYLVKQRLSQLKGRLQEDYFNPKLNKGAECILNYQVIDTNFDKISSKYYLDDYHVTEAQKSGFKYSLDKLKGTHVWCNPRIQGHAYCVVDNNEFSFNVYQSLEGMEYRFPQYDNVDYNADIILRNNLHKMLEEDQYLQLPNNLSDDEKDEITIQWIQNLIAVSHKV